jgi:hypothetical protein
VELAHETDDEEDLEGWLVPVLSPELGDLTDDDDNDEVVFNDLLDVEKTRELALRLQADSCVAVRLTDPGA